MRILFVSPWYPDPPDNGAKLRISNLLSALCSRHRVTLIAAHDPAVPLSSTLRKPLSQCEKVISVPWMPRPVRDVRRFLSFLWSRPEWVFFNSSKDMRAAISGEIETDGYDLIIAYELSTALYIPARVRTPAILEDVELGGYLAGTQTGGFMVRARRRLFAWKLRRALRSLLRRVIACTVPSPAERDLLTQFVPNVPPIEVIPNCLDNTRYEEIAVHPKPETLIFTGALTFEANYDAVKFFLREIYPLIKRELPRVQFCITGRHNDISVPLIEQDTSVRLAGFVDDVRPLIAGSWVSIVPLLTGGGTRFKILEAMALGTPVVSTSKGAEGLILTSGEYLLISDSPQGFAAAVVRLCRDHILHERLSKAGRHYVAEHHTWQVVAPRYLAWVERIAGKNITNSGGNL